MAGVPVPLAALEEFLASLSGTGLATRLGLGEYLASDNQDALRGWAAKVLLVDQLVALEAARLAVEDPLSIRDWVGQLEAAGEVCGIKPATRAEAFAHYRANAHLYRVAEARRARHVLFPSEESALELIDLVRSLEDLAALAAEHSIDEGCNERGGDLGWVERGQLAGPLEQAIFTAMVGQICGPVESCFGWHIVGVEATRPGCLRTFSDCEPQILADLDEDRVNGAWAQWWRRRLAQRVAVAPGFEHPLRPGVPGLPHRH